MPCKKKTRVQDLSQLFLLWRSPYPQIAQRMEERLKHLSPAERAQMIPGPEDFDPDGARPAQDTAAIFQDLVGCGRVCPTL